MSIAEAIKSVKIALESLELKATNNNLVGLSVAHFWLDKIAEACNNVDKQKGGEPVDGESEKKDD